jgi:hypothetical protein
MPVSDQLIAAIIQSLQQSVDSIITDPLESSDLFEAYIFTLTVEAAQSQGATVTYEQIGKDGAQEFVFRTSPGHIYSTQQPYTYAVIEFTDAPPLESHLGIRVSGKSLVLHECDIAVIRREEGNRCRLEMTAPRSSTVIAAIEAKFYGANLKLSLAREFVGLASDLSAKHPCFVANIHSDSVARLLAFDKNRAWYDSVVPNSAEANRLISFLSDVFYRYRVRA